MAGTMASDQKKAAPKRNKPSQGRPSGKGAHTGQMPPPSEDSDRAKQPAKAEKTDRMGLFILSSCLIALYLGITFPLGIGDLYLAFLICLTAGTGYAVYLDMRNERFRQELLLQAANVQNAGMTQLVGVVVAQLQRDGENMSEDGTWTVECGNVRRVFEPGRLIRVEDANTNTEHIYKYEDDGTIMSEVYVSGMRRYLIRTTELGAPIIGYVYSDDGKIQVEYTYDEIGQVKVNLPENGN